MKNLENRKSDVIRNPAAIAIDPKDPSGIKRILEDLRHF